MTDSRQPRKQRKFRANAPHHVKRKYLSAPLSPSLREDYGRRRFPVKTGDTVMVMRGEFKGEEGKVQEVFLDKSSLIIEGVATAKADGSDVPRPIHASNVQITKLDLSDDRRKEALER